MCIHRSLCTEIKWNRTGMLILPHVIYTVEVEHLAYTISYLSSDPHLAGLARIHLVKPADPHTLSENLLLAGHSISWCLTSKSCSLAHQHPACPAQRTPQSHCSHYLQVHCTYKIYTYTWSTSPRSRDYVTDIYLCKTGMCWLVYQGEGDPYNYDVIIIIWGGLMLKLYVVMRLGWSVFGFKKIGTCIWKGGYT